MNRVSELDGIRCIAVFMVLIHHSVFGHAHIGPAAGLMIVGVDLFFVLSGFLITQIILRNLANEQFYLNFYIRRSLRIWPIYYLVIFVYFAASLGFPSVPKMTTRDLLHFVTFTQTVPFETWKWVDILPLAPLWSVAVEEQFYLFWPPLVRASGRRRVVYLCAALILTAVTARALGCFIEQIIARLDGLALGALLAVLLSAGDGRWARSRWLPKAMLIVGAIAFLGPFWIRLLAGQFDGDPGRFASLGHLGFSLDVFNFDLASSCFIGLCVIRQGATILAPLRNAVVVYLGRISYGIYLYHYPIFRTVLYYLGEERCRSFEAFLGCVLLTVGIASLSWFLIERPILRLKDFYNYKPVAALPAGATPSGGF